MDADPTPALRTVVGISSLIHIQSIPKEEETQKLENKINISRIERNKFYRVTEGCM